MVLASLMSLILITWQFYLLFTSPEEAVGTAPVMLYMSLVCMVAASLWVKVEVAAGEKVVLKRETGES